MFRLKTLEKHLSPDYKADPNKTDPDDTRYFYPNLANTHAFNNPIAINNKADIHKKMISEIRSNELANKLNYPSSGYKLKSITAFKIFIYHRDHALGDSEAVIPKNIRENEHVINFPKTNNKCVFRCIAWHTFQSPKKDPRRIQAQVKQAFKRYCSFKGIKYSLRLFRSFKPIDLLQLDEIEDCFQLGINVYKMDAKYQCPKCEMVFVSAERVKNHKKNQCELVNIESFPAESTIYKPAIRSLFTKYSIKNTDQYIDHFIVYDFETILKPTATQHGENTVFTKEQIPVSVSVADTLTEEVRCFVNDDPKMLLTDMFKYIGDVSVKIQQYNVNKYKSLLQKIINAHGLTGMEIPGVNLGKTYKMSDVEGWIEQGKYAFDFHSSLGFDKRRSDYGKLKQQLNQVPVFGFNSGRYDINLIKKDLFAVIGTDNIKSVSKNPSYMCIATSDMKMLDISNYVPAHTSTINISQDILVAANTMTKLDVSVVLIRSQLTHSRYKNQDAQAKRKFGITLKHLNTLLQKQKYLCGLCYRQLTADTASADRINNNLGHIDGNPKSILISCMKCNSARKDMSLGGFRYKNLLEFNSDRLVYSIFFREDKHIYAKMKANIAGGPTIIFNRYAKRNETTIRGGKVCKKIIGYDANALYLWALGNEMPCGRLTTVEAYEGIIENITADKIFGFLECDIHTPENLKQYFGEMTPIFKNVLIHCTNESVIGKHMFDHNEARKQSRAKPARKLIEGDVDKSKAMIAEMMKPVGNSAFGRSGMDMSKHKEVKYESSDKAIKSKIEHFTFHGLEELDNACEITMKKRRHNNKNPIHLSIAIYQLAKLRMLQFYYDCIYFYFDRSDFQYQEMDTDSAYIAFSCENPFQDSKFDRRTPGLFKDEWLGDAMVSLSSKNYICYLPDESYKVKVSAKGIQQGGGRKNGVLNPDGFETVVRDRITLQGTSKGFRLSKETKSIITYSQTKTALNYYYDKRRLYYDLKTGFIGAQALYHKAKELNPKITLKIVRYWYSSQTDIQRFQEQNKQFNGFKIASHNPNAWQMDLAFGRSDQF
ncbi:unnamed protein product [Phytophthora lilii]|uniref:Unnamed protein product n=1 Tax=Phytophthora lilii TaxID=2077276 RepID=A0A9W6YGV7_9STRA|nr:unnamed protein product [Phytophthora lilii]